jgi:hypothetical protein
MRILTILSHVLMMSLLPGIVSWPIRSQTLVNQP